MEKVQKYKYLGTIVNDNNKYTEQIGSRIGQGRTIFNKMKTVPTMHQRIGTTAENQNAEMLRGFSSIL